MGRMKMKVLFALSLLLAAVVFINAVPAVSQPDDSDFVIVANKQVQGSTISSATLKGIYLREIRSWGNGGGEITPVDLSSASGFYQNLFGKSYVQMQAYWLNMRVKYSADLPVSKKDSESVKQYISENKGSIGFLKSSDLDDRIKTLKVVN
jgi:ABC-type phosphate transport system substrate-binding protein